MQTEHVNERFAEDLAALQKSDRFQCIESRAVGYGWVVELKMLVNERPHHVTIMVGSNYPYDSPRAFAATFKYRMGTEVARNPVDFEDEFWVYNSTLVQFARDVQLFMESI